MIFVFKLLFAFLGFRIAGFFGYSILYGTGIGLVVGHVADSVALVKMQKYKAKKYWEKHARAQYNNTFFNSFFLLLGKICLADGLINKEEIQAVEKICDEVLKIKRSEKKAALKIFKEALKSPSSVQYDAAQFYEIHKTQPQTLENMVVFLFQVSASDGHISPLEESLIKTVAQIFNLPEQRYLDIASNFMNIGRRDQRSRSQQDSGSQQEQKKTQNGFYASESSSDQHYTTLGCSRNDPANVIKQKYRKLVSEYHPDKIVGKNLPEDFTKFANEKFKAIQEAYEAVKAEKGFN